MAMMAIARPVEGDFIRVMKAMATFCIGLVGQSSSKRNDFSQQAAGAGLIVVVKCGIPGIRTYWGEPKDLRHPRRYYSVYIEIVVMIHRNYPEGLTEKPV